ncbi:MAG: hypothetical protein WA634_02465, partial [Silvibacterium sp.]
MTLATLTAGVPLQVPNSQTLNTLIANLSETDSVQIAQDQDFNPGSTFTLGPNGYYTAAAGNPIWVQCAEDNLLWTEQSNSSFYAPGTVQAVQPQRPLGSVVIPAGETTASFDANPDGIATALLLVCRPLGQNYIVIANGSVTGLNYLETTIGVTGGAAIAFAVPGSDDDPIEIAVHCLGGPVGSATDAVDVYELTGAGYQQVGNTEFNPLFVQVT